MDQPEVIGRLGSTHGIKGWLRVHSFTQVAQDIFSFVNHWQCRYQGKWQPVKVLEWRAHGNGFLCSVQGVDTREGAELLVGRDIGILPDFLPTLPEGEYYWRDLTGCRVRTLAGYDMGVVRSLMETGSNDVLVVRAHTDDAMGVCERLVPFLPHQVIKRVDVRQQSIIVDWDPSF